MVIISGGQTGVDRAAWDVALEMGLKQDGWVPRGRWAEDGRIPDRYRCQEITQPFYAARTVQNLLNAEATLIICFGPPTGGTQLTIRLCEKHKKPHLVIDLDNESFEQAVERAASFIRKRDPKQLNVAGPRASYRPDVYERARTFLSKVFQGLS